MLLVGPLVGQVVIHEIHYDPADETSREEFVELYNGGEAEVDVSGWRLTEAIEWVFPAGTTIPAGGYEVVGEDPATLMAVFGVAAAGPWEKGLSNDGERLILEDAAGQVVDEVDYGVGFPWPTGARGGGGSMELMHPQLDNDLGGSWRTSGAAGAMTEQTYIGEAANGWKWRAGSSEASVPASAWRERSFAEDASWQVFQAPIGYGSVSGSAGSLSFNTVISGMRNQYSCIFLRRDFTIEPGELPEQLKLRYAKDDGVLIWINGHRVAQRNMGSSEPAFDDLAASDSDPEGEWYEDTIADAKSFLIEGRNVVAVQVFNGTLSSSDLGFDLALIRPASDEAWRPTPGARNASFTTEVPPQIRQVAHDPVQPAPGDPVVVTAKVTDSEGVAEVHLVYQVVDPGGYIRLGDPEYESSWTSVEMNDEGVEGDEVAGDGVFTATVPGEMQTHRRLMRYRIAAVDGAGHGLTVPYADDGQPNFAWFVYGDYPSWSGAFSASRVAETFPAGMMDRLPVYQLLAKSVDVTRSQYESAYDGVHMRGTLVYDGVVYDHIRFENRGEVSTYRSGKNKWRFHFNRARRLAARDDWGQKYDSPWSKLNLNACASPWAAVNRGMAGLDEAVSFRLYGMAGVPSARTHYLSLRIIDDAVEVSPTSQYEGDLWGLYLAVEQPNGSFLKDRGLEDGNVYKIEDGAGDQKEQGDTQEVNGADWDRFYAASASAQTESWWRDQMDMEVYDSMRAMNRFTGNVDLRFGFNHYFYHEPTMDRWVVMPWDLDMMFIAETHQSGVIRQQNSILNHPALALEFRNRCREILDLMASDRSVSGGQIGQLLDEYAQMVNPSGEALTWADLDAAMWNEHPRTQGDPNSHSGQTNHKGNFYYSPFTDSRMGGDYVRTLVSRDHEGFVRHLLDYTTDTFPGTAWSPGNGVPAGYGFEYLSLEAQDALIPERPTLEFVGTEGFPVTDLRFRSGAFSDPNGDGSFGGMRWRLAEIAAPGLEGYVEGTPRRYELEAEYEEESTAFVDEFAFPVSSVIPGHTYRVRVQHEDQSGRTSHWSEPIEFVASGADVASYTGKLVISEIHYHPANPSGAELEVATDDGEFEFVELFNASPGETLDLSPLAFSDGIVFDFATASVRELGPGERLVVVSNAAAFEARYGVGLPVAGEFTGALNNGGETLALAWGGSTPVVSLTYGDRAPWPTAADGEGFSLVLLDPEGAPDPAVAEHWVAGAVMHGTPGTGEPMEPSYASWSREWFSTEELADDMFGGPEADADGDGLANLLEFALGRDPRASDSAGAVEWSWVETSEGPALALTFRRRIERGRLEYAIERSEDLSTWNGVSGEEVSVVSDGDGFERVTLRSESAVEGMQEFLRLAVSER